jgi:WS/DGAT/MGAT family acyltransferase
MQQLTGLDAAFLYLDASNAPMQVGGVHIYAPPKEGFGFAEFRNHVAASLGGSPVFRRRVVQVPMRLGRPFWAPDPQFDLDAHVQHGALPVPGDWARLTELAARHFSRPLDPDRPLWHMTFVEGLVGFPDLPEGSFAVISRIHHAGADGLGALDMLNALWTPKPVRRKVPGKRKGRSVKSLPGPASLLKQSLLGGITQPRAAVDWAWSLLRGGVGAGVEFIEGDHHAPPMLFQAPRSPFNVPISARRTFDAVDLPLGEIRRIRAAVDGATVNDVVLAVCGGGLSRYLRKHGDVPERDLVAMAPISVRGEMDSGSNRVSAMLVPLEIRLREPVARLKRIHRHAVDSKAYASAIGARTLADTSQFVPYSLATAASRLYSGLHLSRYHRPPFNLVITNVPGPREPLYLGRAELLAGYGHAPVLDGLGLILVVTSYKDTLTISATAGFEAAPDVEDLVDCLREGFADLKASVVRARKRRTRARSSGRKGRAAASG